MSTRLAAASLQRWEVGTQGNFGSLVDSSVGWTLMGWVATTQQSVFPIILNFSTGAEGAPGAGNQSLFFMIQTGYTTDVINDPNHVVVNFGDYGDVGVLWHQEISDVTLGDGKPHHYAVSVIASGSGANSNANAPIVWYVDGVAYTNWTKPYNDGLGTVSNFINPLAVGATRKNGGVWFDHTTGDFEDLRIYQRALSSYEISQIYKQRGRDTIRRSLLSRYPFFADGKNIGPDGTPATPISGASVVSRKLTSGTRRKVM